MITAAHKRLCPCDTSANLSPTIVPPKASVNLPISQSTLPVGNLFLPCISHTSLKSLSTRYDVCAAEGYSAGACFRGHPHLTISLHSKRFAVSRTSLSTATHGLSTVALLSFSAHEALYNKSIVVHEGSKSFLSHRYRHTVCNEDTCLPGSNKQLDDTRKRQDC